MNCLSLENRYRYTVHFQTEVFTLYIPIISSFPRRIFAYGVAELTKFMECKCGVIYKLKEKQKLIQKNWLLIIILENTTLCTIHHVKHLSSYTVKISE